VAGFDSTVEACKTGMGNVYAPYGAVYIREGGIVTGGFLCKDAIIWYDVELFLDDGF